MSLAKSAGIALLVYSPFAFATWPFASPDPEKGYAEDHLIIKFYRDRTDTFADNHRTNLLGDLGRELQVPSVEVIEAFPENAVTGGRPDFGRFKFLKVNPPAKPHDIIRRLKGHPLVEYVELDHVGTGGGIPNDPNYGSQWHLPKIDAPNAWDITTGSSNVIVALLDTGLNNSNGEFTGRTVSGYDFANNDSDPADDFGHGTAAAGVIAANANNSVLGVGVDWKCKLMPVKVLDANNSGFYSWWASGLDWAVAHGCKVANLSAGGASSDTTLRQSILNAIASGVVFVTITHNDGSGTIRFPGNLTNCITVGATDAQDRRSSFSNYGPQIDLVAPGTNICTVFYSGGISYWWGTSLSAPQASGVAALLASLRPNITQEQVQTLLCAGAEDQVGDANDTPGFDNYYGWGRLNAYNTLLLAQTQATAARSNNTVTLSWHSPANVTSKKPYRIDFANSASGPWTTLSASSNFIYGATNTSWKDNGSETGGLPISNRFYRLRIVSQ
jgi:subtilisin family serine protease